MCIRLEALDTAGVRFGIKGIVCAKSVPSSARMSATEERLSSFKQVKENSKETKSSPNCNVFAFFFFFFQSYSRCRVFIYFNFIYMLSQDYSFIISHPCAVEARAHRFKDPQFILRWRRWFEMNCGFRVDATAWHF